MWPTAEGGTLQLAKVKVSITMSHQQLTEEKRYQISTLLTQGYSPAAIAGVVEAYSRHPGNGRGNSDNKCDTHG
jgi:hypothetical protein